MMNFCTFFDKNYLPRGLALLGSLEEHAYDFKLYILCLDDFVFNFFKDKANANVILIKISEVENYFPELLAVKLERSTIEYYFTLSPFLPLYILRNFPKIDHICSLDADIYFYNDPQELFNLLTSYSIVITPHKYHPQIETSGSKYGKFNVSFQIFKNDLSGVNCLKNWAKKCIEWCYDYYDEENHRYADQKYLDYWYDLFGEQVYGLENEGAGIACWNINNYKLRYVDGKWTVNEKPLIFYHFHNFKIFNRFTALNGFGLYNVFVNDEIIKLYASYWKALDQNAVIGKFNELMRSKGLNRIKILLINKIFFIRMFNKIGIVKIDTINKILTYIKTKKWHTS